MNLDDLSTELRVRADQAPGQAPASRLSGVRHRIRVRRRRQVAAATGLIALCAAAFVLAPDLTGIRADRLPTPPATDAPVPAPMQSPPSSGPLHIAALEGDTIPLVAAGVSRPGQRVAQLRFTPGDTNLQVDSFCRLPQPDSGLVITTTTTVNGHVLGTGSCTPGGQDDRTTTGRAANASANRALWAERGVRAGVESVLEIQVEVVGDAATSVPPLLQLGLAVYDRNGTVVVSDGVTLHTLIEVDGHRYFLETYRTAPATDARRSLKITANQHVNPGLVLGGNPGDDGDAGDAGAAARARVLVDGTQAGSVAAGGTVSREVDDVDDHTFEVRLDPGLRGTMVIAYYVDLG